MIFRNLFLAALTTCLLLSSNGYSQEGWVDSGQTVGEESLSQPAQQAPPHSGQTQYPAERKYHFLFFFREQNPQTDSMWQVFQETMNQVPDRASWKAVNLSDPASEPLVKAYNLGNPVTPLVLSIAPNGAIMGVFPEQFTQDQLMASFGTPGQEASQKVLLQGKMVLVCLQNERTQFNQQALAGVQSFLADPRFSKYAEAVKVDPADPSEGLFMRNLQIDPSTQTAMTILMTPPGVPVSTLSGATTKETFVSELKMEGGCGADCKCLESVPTGGDSKPVLSKFFTKIAGKFKNAG